MKKKLIRSGVWETNSSSSHSISIADETKEFVLDTIYPDQNGVVHIEGDEFGWQWFKHNDAATKAGYSAQQYSDNDFVLELLEELIKEQTGADKVEFNLWGYVDHDSYGIVPSDKESLRNFIFNKNSWLFGGNDNSTADPTFYDVPEYGIDGSVVTPKYMYELVIDGYHKTTKFKKIPTSEELTDAFESLLQSVYLSKDGVFDDDDSIMAQITRNRSNMFTFESYRVPVDEVNKVITFISDNLFVKARSLYEKRFPNMDWGNGGYAKTREIERELIADPDSGACRKVSYQLIAIN